MFLSRDDAGNELREEYAYEFEDIPELLERVVEESLEAGEACAAGRVEAKDSAYKQTDVCSELLAYHDKNQHTFACHSHQFGNMIKHIYGFVSNRTSSKKVTSR
jgi:hypothetical protein